MLELSIVSINSSNDNVTDWFLDKDGDISVGNLKQMLDHPQQQETVSSILSKEIAANI